MGEVAYAIGLALELLYGSFQWFLSLAMAKGNENRKQKHEARDSKAWIWVLSITKQGSYL